MNEDEMKKFREWLKELLHEREVSITFRKVDGSKRVMRCTLETDKLPPLQENNENKSKRATNDKVLAVWDVEANGWRSFQLDSVLEVAFSLNKGQQNGCSV